MRDEGLVRAVGITSSREAALHRLLKEYLQLNPGLLDTIMIWRRFNLIDDRFADEVLPLASAARVGVIVAAPFHAGILATGRTEHVHHYEPLSGADFAWIDQVTTLCNDHSVSYPAAALQFCLRGHGVASVVAGAIAADQLTDNVRAIHEPIPAAFWSELDAFRQERRAATE